nr:hypothetical protein [Escherichia coli]
MWYYFFSLTFGNTVKRPSTQRLKTSVGFTQSHRRKSQATVSVNRCQFAADLIGFHLDAKNGEVRMPFCHSHQSSL